MLSNYLAKESSLNSLIYYKDEPLAPHSTFGIGGQCDYFVKPLNESALIALIGVLKKTEAPYFVIGNGSNLLFDDRGFRGCVISTKELKTVTLRGETIHAECGASLIALSSLAAKHSLTGLEFACSIPATLGGAVYMNAGAYGGEMKDIITTVRYLDTDGSVQTTLDHGFDYRHSVYQNTDRIILSASLTLKSGSGEEIYARMQENKAKRSNTQPIHEKSAGSVFRRMENVIPAKLIDEAGLKGLCVGDAAVSCKHAGFIVNKGNATSADVLALIALIETTIQKRYGVSLSCEIRYIPERQ